MSPLGSRHTSWLFRGKKGESNSKYRDSGSKTHLKLCLAAHIYLGPRLGLESSTLLVSVSKSGLENWDSGKLCYYQSVLKAWMVLKSSLKSRKVRSRGQYSWHLDCLSAADKNDKYFWLKISQETKMSCYTMSGIPSKDGVLFSLLKYKRRHGHLQWMLFGESYSSTSWIQISN